MVGSTKVYQKWKLVEVQVNVYQNKLTKTYSMYLLSVRTKEINVGTTYREKLFLVAPYTSAEARVGSKTYLILSVP